MSPVDTHIAAIAGRRRSTGRWIALLVGGVVALLLLEGGLRFAGATFLWSQQRSNRQAMAAGGAVTVLCVGESTTAMGGPESYPAQLEQVLAEQGGDPSFAVVNRGIPGGDSSMIAARMEADLATYQPQIVVAMMGANDNHSAFGGGAVPFEDAPQAERGWFPHSLRTYQLLRQARHGLARVEDDGFGAPLLRVQRGLHEAPCAADGGVRRDEPVCAGIDDAWSLARAGDREGAERAMRDAVQRNPGSAVPGTELGVLLWNTGRADDGEAALRAALRIESTGVDTWVELGELLRQSERLEEAQDAFRRAVAADGSCADAHYGLATALDVREDPDEALAALDRAIELEPTRPGFHVLRGHVLMDRGQDTAAVAAFEAALERMGDETWINGPVDHLVTLHERSGDHAEIVSLYQRVLARRPEDVDILHPAAKYHARRGDEERAAALRAEVARITETTYCPLTRSSYEELLEMTRSRGILLVAVQYPRHPVEPLARLFDGAPGVVFVDNQASFDEAVAGEGYPALFLDRCYARFGHGTRRGNRLLADNVARVILAEVDP